MARRFNTAGPNDPADHYTWPALARLPEVRRLIEEKRYFVLRAPEQSGKTTALLALAHALTCEGRFAAIVLSVAGGAPFGDQPGRAEDAILDAWQGAASLRLPPELRPPAWPEALPGQRISRALQAWAEEAPRPLVLLIDDIDSLEGPALASVLRQVREGFPDRPHHFPWCVVLAGARDVLDDKSATGCGGEAGADGPFAIGSDALTLRDFSAGEVAALCHGHTKDTGQVFVREAVDRVLDLTRGQPWLVNALVRQIVEVFVPDRETAIRATHVDFARDILVHGHAPHFDRLGVLLCEPRVAGILEPLLSSAPPGPVPDEERRMLVDLGVLRSSEDGELAIANPIYREVLQRHLARWRRSSVPLLPTAPVRREGSIALARVTSRPSYPVEARVTVRPSYPVERAHPKTLGESFERGCSVVPGPGDVTDLPPPLRHAASPLGLALAAGLCVLGALIAVSAGSGESPASAMPAVLELAAAMPPAVVERAETLPAALPREAPATRTAAPPPAVTAELVPRPPAATVPAKVRSAPTALTLTSPPRPPARRLELDDPDGLLEQPPVGRVVPAPPPLQLDSDRMRRELELKVWAGGASTDEIRMLKAVCSSNGDHGCRDRARAMLERRGR